MKSFYIITGGILAMIAIVLMAPKKTANTEDKASIPLDEIDATILKKYGIDLSGLVPEDKEMFRQNLSNGSPEIKPKSKNNGESSPKKNDTN